MKFHKAEEGADRTTEKPLVPPAAGAAQIDAKENTPHKRDDTLHIAMAK